MDVNIHNLKKLIKDILKSLNFFSRRHIIFLIIIILFSVVNNYIIISNDTRILGNDPASRFATSLRYYFAFADLITNHETSVLKHELNKIWHGDTTPFLPPLSMLAPLPFYYFFGKNPRTAIMFNSLYIVILIFSVYGIGKHLYNKKVGIFAAFITMTIPSIFALSRTYGADFPVIAMTMLSLFLLLLSEDFTNRKYSLLFGIVTGFSLLTKLTYIIYFITIGGLYTLLNFKILKTKQIKNIVFAIICLIVIAAPWYIPNSKVILSESSSIMHGKLAEESQDKSFKNINFNYVINQCKSFINNLQFDMKSLFFITDRLSFLYTSIFLFALGYFFSHKKEKKDILMLGSMFLPFFFWIITIQNVPVSLYILYISPSLPLFSIFIASFLLTSRIKTLIPGFIIIFVVIIAGVLQFMLISYLINIEGDLPSLYSMIDSYGLYTLQQQENWDLESIANFINSQDKGKKAGSEFILIPSSPTTTPFPPAALVYVLQMQGKIINLGVSADDLGFFTSSKDYDYEKGILNSDYVIVYEEREATHPQKLSNAQLIARIRFIEEFNKHIEDFKLLKKFEVKKNLTFYIYKKNN